MPKCTLCGKNIPKGEAYVAHTMSNTGRVYKKNYCSEAEYINHQNEMKYRDKVMKLVVDYMGYIKGGILPHEANKQLTELSKIYSYEAIYNVLVAIESDFRYGMQKEFTSGYGRIKYFLAILSNNINEEYSKLQGDIKVATPKERDVNHQNEMGYKDKAIELIVDYMGYDRGSVLPSEANKQLTELNKTYSYEVIYEVLRALESDFRSSMNKEFINGYGRAKYFFAVLFNVINEEYARLKREIRIEKAKEQQVVHIEEELMDKTEGTKQIKSKVSDISSFLD